MQADLVWNTRLASQARLELKAGIDAGRADRDWRYRQVDAAGLAERPEDAYIHIGHSGALLLDSMIWATEDALRRARNSKQPDTEDAD